MRLFRFIAPILLGAVLALSACTTGPRQGATQPQYGNDLALTLGASLQSFAVGAFDLHYAEAGEIGKPTVVFIHGTPGSWRALGRLLGDSELRQRARMVAIDRPGWGGSLMQGKEAEGSFAEQVKLIAPLLGELKSQSGGQPLILVGHSLGASYAPYIAFRHPELVDGVLMAAGAIDRAW